MAMSFATDRTTNAIKIKNITIAPIHTPAMINARWVFDFGLIGII